MSGLRTTRIPHTDLEVSRLAYGGVQFAAWDRNPITAEEIRKGIELVDVALEQGITLFDHADIYGHGKCEEVFSAVWEAIPGARERMVLQSKCGIRRPEDDKSITHYDFSYEHITSAVEGSLKRLKVERLDVLLLHRPDALVEPDEVARAVAHLKTQGMIRYLGVSNHNIGQIALLQRSLAEPLVANQLELSLLHHGLISDGLIVNTPGTPQAQSLSGLLDYSRLHGLQIPHHQHPEVHPRRNARSTPLLPIELPARCFRELVEAVPLQQPVQRPDLAGRHEQLPLPPLAPPAHRHRRPPCQKPLGASNLIGKVTTDNFVHGLLGH